MRLRWIGGLIVCHTVCMLGCSNSAGSGGAGLDTGKETDGDTASVLSSEEDTGTASQRDTQFDSHTESDAEGDSDSIDSDSPIDSDPLIDSDPATQLTASLRVLTRNAGVSPETVYFSAQGSVDPTCEDFSGGSDMEACRTGQYLGFHFNFDDPDAGFFDTTGNSRNEQIGGSPRAIHTFECEGPENSRYNPDTERCEFNIGVRVQNPNGESDDAFVTVSISPQSAAYSLEETYCISANGDYTACPAGVPETNRLRDTPATGEFSGHRILYQRGSSGEYADICIGYHEKRVRIDTYGIGERPVVSGLQIGVTDRCDRRTPTTETAMTYPAPTKDENGYITSGWAYDIGVSGLRLGAIHNGMSLTLVTMHDLDLDWSSDGRFSGSVALASNGQNCDDNEALDCSVVPYPYGIFASEVRSLGHPSNLPLINFSCLTNCGLINGGLIGNEAKAAIEHNSRFMGSWGLVVSNVWHRGDHIGGRGGKAKLTLRQITVGNSGTLSSQTVDPENFVNGNHDGTGPGWVRETDVTRQFTPHFDFIVDSIFNDTVQDAATEESGFVVFNSGHRYCGLFGNAFLTYPGAESNPAQITMGGVNMVALDTTYNEHNITCRLSQLDSHLPDGSYYLDTARIFSDASDGKCNGGDRSLPHPESPMR